MPPFAQISVSLKGFIPQSCEQLLNKTCRITCKTVMYGEAKDA